jgi:heptaprenyl diphosphate synthase
MSSFGIPDLSPALEADLAKRMVEVEALLRLQIEGKYPLVIETSRHLVEAGGKRLRPLLTLITSHYGDPTAHGVIEAAVVCELTHVATLYHDDVMDEAPLRRGVQSANNRWGNTVAILTGDYLFARTSDMLADLGPAAVHLQAQTFERLVIGQIMETQGPADGADPLQHYLGVVADKTGSLIAASAQFGAMLAGAPSEQINTLAAFGEKIGITFQLVDDVIDIASQSYESGKTPGTDLKEGVPTLVTLNVLKSTRMQDRDLQELLKGPISDQNVINQVLDQLRTHPALDQSREQLLDIANQARNLLRPLPVNDATGALFSLCDAVIDRSA